MSNKPTNPDVLSRLKDIHKQATVERSHFYVGSVVHEAIVEIERLRRIEMSARALVKARDDLKGIRVRLSHD